MNFTILNKKELASSVSLMEIKAPLIAQKAQAGQFVVVIADEKSERIPLTLADWNRDLGTIKIIFQQVGYSTQKLASLKIKDNLFGVLGPLGNPTNLKKIGTVICIGGGVGIAEIFPVARGFKQQKNNLITIIGARNKDLLILESELKDISDELLIATDDGSKGTKGFVTDILKSILNKNEGLNSDNCLVFAVGPVLMMKKVSEVTKPKGIKTIVSLNPIMVDATGMCGACRVVVNNKVRFACVDGPEFDAHLIDFDKLIIRLKSHEQAEHNCQMKPKLTQR